MPRAAHNSEVVCLRHANQPSVMMGHLSWAAMKETVREEKNRPTMVIRQETFFCTYCGTSTIVPDQPMNAPKRGFRTIKCHTCKRVQIPFKRLYFLKHPECYIEEAQKKKRKRQKDGTKPHIQTFTEWIEAEEIDKNTFIEHMKDIECETQMEEEESFFKFAQDLFCYDAIIVNMIIHFGTVRDAVFALAEDGKHPIWVFLSQNWLQIRREVMYQAEQLIFSEHPSTLYTHMPPDEEDSDSNEEEEEEEEAETKRVKTE